MAENNGVFDGKASAEGISLSDGKPVYAKPVSQNVYVDTVHNDESDVADIHIEKSKKMSKKDRTQITVLAALNIAVFMIIGIYLLVTGGGDEYKNIKEDAAFNPATGYYNASTVFDGELQVMINGRDFPQGIQPRFMALYSENADTVGWIKIDGTSIDFPVLQGENNDKYHRSNFYLEYDRRGSIFLDSRNSLGNGVSSLSKNTIIYGHHLTEDECVFADVEKYMNAEYYKAHPIIEFDTIYNDCKWKIFSCFITNVEPEDDNGYVFYYWNPDISDADTVAFANECITRSWFVNPAVDIQSTDKLLCLSTCTYILNRTEFIEARCVLMARLVREGESTEVDVTGAYENTQKRMPQIWYTQNGLQNPYAAGPFWTVSR